MVACVMPRGEMAQAEHPKEIFSTHEAARVCRVTPMTVIRWIKEGKIPAFRTAGGHRRILYADLARFCAARGIPFVQSEPAEAGRILVADADPEVRELVSEAIRSVDERFAVELVGDAFAAGRTLAAFRPTLFFLDQRLPGVDALDVCARLVHDTDAPVGVAILVTGPAGPAPDVERAFKSRGALGCVARPPARAAIEKLVRLAFHLPEAAQAPAIHVLDRDVRAARALRRALEARLPGCRVSVFESPLDLAFALGSETPDALIVDAGALELSAVELVRKVVARGSGAPAVIVASSARTEVAAGAVLHAGARKILTKPVAVDDVLEALDERRRGGRGGRRDPRH